MALRKPLKTVTELKGNNGIKIPVSEYEVFKDVVLLNDLKFLYAEKSPKTVERLDKLKPTKIDIIRKNCPDHFRYIFKNSQKDLNLEMVAERYKIYFDFILRFNESVYIIDKFEEFYFTIIDLLNKSIDNLAGTRRVNNYFVENHIQLGWGDPDEIEIKYEEKSIAESKFLKNKYDSEFLPEILIPKIVWNDKRELLIKMFDEFRKSNYVLYDNDEQLLQHFYIKDSNRKASVENLNMDKSSVIPLHWNHNLNSLALFVDTLRSERKIEFKDDNGYYVLIAEHFIDKYKKEMTNKQIGDASGRNALNKRKKWFVNFYSKLCQILDIQSS